MAKEEEVTHNNESKLVQLGATEARYLRWKIMASPCSIHPFLTWKKTNFPSLVIRSRLLKSPQANHHHHPTNQQQLFFGEILITCVLGRPPPLLMFYACLISLKRDWNWFQNWGFVRCHHDSFCFAWWLRWFWSGESRFFAQLVEFLLMGSSFSTKSEQLVSQSELLFFCFVLISFEAAGWKHGRIG